MEFSIVSVDFNHSVKCYRQWHDVWSAWENVCSVSVHTGYLCCGHLYQSSLCICPGELGSDSLCSHQVSLHFTAKLGSDL